MTYLIDASAIICMLWDEPGADAVIEKADGACMSAVNFSEVSIRLARDGLDPRELLEDVLEFGIDVLDFDFRCFMRLIDVQAYERRSGVRLSLGDRCCLATAMAEDLAILTADREWSHFADLADIHFVR